MPIVDIVVEGAEQDIHLPLNIQGVNRITGLQEVKSYIFNMDMSMIFTKMTNQESAGELGLLWEEEDAEFAINQYRQYLYILKKYPKKNSSPTLAIDAVWHNHILDTRMYVQDCQAIFGSYLHHYPYFGSRGEEDRRQLKLAFENTKQLFKKEFNVDI